MTNKTSKIIRTERGLTIAGTRITLYQLMDYIHAGYPTHLISHKFMITDEQFQAAINYIETHYDEIEAEYKLVLKQAEEIRQYWEEYNHQKLINIKTKTPKSEYKTAWEKLKLDKYKLEPKL
ncbi:MAG: DUF433 domain-containing protein [Crocosphaera sp.]|nr:DUF433 domain-containing protein [Crocosphaera sp.]